MVFTSQLVLGNRENGCERIGRISCEWESWHWNNSLLVPMSKKQRNKTIQIELLHDEGNPTV